MRGRLKNWNAETFGFCFQFTRLFLFFISNDLESKDKMPNKVPRKPIKNILKENTNMRMGANTDLMVSFVFSYTS